MRRGRGRSGGLDAWAGSGAGVARDPPNPSSPQRPTSATGSYGTRVTLASRVGHRPDVGCRRCLATLQFTRRGILRYTASLTSLPSARSESHIHYLGGPMCSASRLILTSAVALALGACSDPQRSPTELAATGGPAFDATQPWGPETPNFNLEVVLRGDGFGLGKFRQPNDADKIVYLDTWVADPLPRDRRALGLFLVSKGRGVRGC